MVEDEDDHIKHLNSQIKKLQDDKSKYIKQKRKEKFIEGRVSNFMEKVRRGCSDDGHISDSIFTDLEDIREWFSSFFGRLYDMEGFGEHDYKEDLNREINEATSVLEERKNTYSTNIDILIASLEKMRPKKKEGK